MLTAWSNPCWGTDSSSTHLLYYDSPAEEWTAALPVGNGRLGCMVFGGISEARFQFNEDTLWNGQPHIYARDGAVLYLPEIRRLLFEGRQKEAEELAEREFMSVPLRQTDYQPFGDVIIRFSDLAKPDKYERSLDLKTATATTRYEINGVQFTRQTIASYPDQVVAIHLTCSKAGALNFQVDLQSPHTKSETKPYDSRTLAMTGKVNGTPRQNADQVEGVMDFAAHIRVSSPDGKIQTTDDRLSVANATEATLLLSAATSFVNFRDISGDPISLSRDRLECIGRSWDKIYRDHVKDYQDLYDRVDLQLGPSREVNLPTDKRILQNPEHPDPSLATLLFNYGRYLMIASSRPGSQPANLQGIWNDSLTPPWGSKYTSNINVEMNYWMVEPCNLGECAEPLFAALRDLAESGRKTAREHYGAPGWVLHHNFDIWRGTAPINASNHGIWPTGGAWLCQQLWEHFLYSYDEQFLRETAYPLMKGAAEFFAAYLIEDPREDREWLISGPSNSPEIGGLVMGPTMDHQIIRSLFANTIEAAKTLGIDPEFQSKLAELRSRIAPNQIGKHGQLQEWLEDLDRPEEKHRHVSHLWGLFPGSEITPDTPTLFAAARQSLEFRGDEGTGWSRAWKINFWARLGDGDRAHKVLVGLLTLTGSPLTNYTGGGVYPNLFDAHPPFQIDGNFGATNGICEMLVQSHRQTNGGECLIELLPALPTAWSEGKLSGIRTRGGFELDIHWSKGTLVHCNVQSLQGMPVVVCYGDKQASLSLAAGESVRLDEELNPD